MAAIADVRLKADWQIATDFQTSCCRKRGYIRSVRNSELTRQAWTR